MDKQGTFRQIDPKKDIVVSRRSFFGALLLVGSAGMGAILAIPVLRYILYPLYAKSGKRRWSPIGAMDYVCQSVASRS